MVKQWTKFSARLDVVGGLRDAGPRRTAASGALPAGALGARGCRPGSRRSTCWRRSARCSCSSRCRASNADQVEAAIEETSWSSPARACFPPSCAPPSSIGWSCRRAASSAALRLPAGRYNAFAAPSADGCLLITLTKVGGLPWLKRDAERKRITTDAASRRPAAAVAVGRAHHRSGAQHRAVSRPRAADHGRPRRARSPPPSRRCASSGRSAS